MFFVDAAHFVFGTFLCSLWSFVRLFVRAASGRQRFNVLAAWNAVTRQLVAVTNTTVVNTETMCELLRKVAAAALTGPITLVLDNARYQHNAAVKALATQLGITLLFLPAYSPNLNLIERLWTEQGFTALLVTHDVSEAVQLADRIILLDQGHIAHNFQVNLPRPRKKSIAFAQLEQQVLDAVLAT